MCSIFVEHFGEKLLCYLNNTHSVICIDGFELIVSDGVELVLCDGKGEDVKKIKIDGFADDDIDWLHCRDINVYVESLVSPLLGGNGLM